MEHFSSPSAPTGRQTRGGSEVPGNHPNVRECRDWGRPRCRKKKSVGSCNEAAKLALAVFVKCFFKSFRDQLVHSKLNPAPFLPFTRLTERERSMDPSLDFHGLHFEHLLISTSKTVRRSEIVVICVLSCLLPILMLEISFFFTPTPTIGDRFIISLIMLQMNHPPPSNELVKSREAVLSLIYFPPSH